MTIAITRDQLASALDNGGVTLVEALPSMYYDQAHLPGAINLPHDQVDDLAPKLLPDRDARIVVYCANTACQNSTAAARRLTELGYRDVLDYEGGKQDWIEAGLPTESTAATAQEGR